MDWPGRPSVSPWAWQGQEGLLGPAIVQRPDCVEGRGPGTKHTSVRWGGPGVGRRHLLSSLEADTEMADGGSLLARGRWGKQDGAEGEVQLRRRPDKDWAQNREPWSRRGPPGCCTRLDGSGQAFTFPSFSVAGCGLPQEGHDLGWGSLCRRSRPCRS